MASQSPAGNRQLLENFLDLEERARGAKTLRELTFTIVNETFRLLPYKQCVLWESDGGVRSKLRSVSGLTKLTEDSPNTLFLKRLGSIISKRLGDEGEYFVASEFDAKMQAEWIEWLPDYLLCFWVKDGQGKRRALVGFALADEATDLQQEWVIRLCGTYGHSWTALAGQNGRRPKLWWRKRFLVLGLALFALALLFVPVRLSVLAQAELISFDAVAVAAPMDGVVKSFAVKPNQQVKKGELILTLEDTSLRNRREVLLKQLAVAKADAMAAQQRAFGSDQSRGELAALNGRVAEREAEVVAIDDLLSRVEVRASRDGLAVFGDINDWQGKPVVTGERIAQLADPNDNGVLIWLPVADAINLDSGSEVRIFLQTAPLKPLNAKVVETSYQASLSSEGIASYRLRARFEKLSESDQALVRVGLKGTAKLYGEEASLGYYLFRRPLATLRQLTGL